ncbi:family 16 glycosylhydrolase [Kineosporia rhizophila]|uniref:glycoside hydrolase family 16 protein n=1 Tax=Kineosporia rhizophila TaxID=84633 RepID=UPI001E5663DB|nr:family 16 glycosylhydrolase [Kineosporia rhizophila]MCE0539243.1 family 16 glycosylhydrolase [Kineosporia rhizophila]
MRASRYRRYLAAAGLSAVTLTAGAHTAAAAPATQTPGTESSATPSAAPSAEATKKPAKKKPSWKLRSEVNFNGSSLPEGCVEYSGEYAAGNSAWSEDNASLKKGVLSLKVEKKRTDGQAYTTGGMGCWNWPQTYGKFEVKAKVPVGKGINSYISLSPAKDNSANAFTSLELLAPDTATAYVSNGYGKGSEQAHSEQDLAKKMHTYTIEWAPKHLLVRLDGEEIFWSDKSYKGSRWLSMATTTGDSLTGKPDKSSKLPKTFEIDSMKIWEYTKVQPEPGQTLSVGADDTIAGATPGASAAPDASASPGASAGATPSGSAAAAAGGSEDDASGGGTLTGGIWPWLIGGSVMVASAVAILSYPGRRKSKKPPAPQPEQYSRPY